MKHTSRHFAQCHTFRFARFKTTLERFSKTFSTSTSSLIDRSSSFSRSRLRAKVSALLLFFFLCAVVELGEAVSCALPFRVSSSFRRSFPASTSPLFLFSSQLSPSQTRERARLIHPPLSPFYFSPNPLLSLTGATFSQTP